MMSRNCPAVVIDACATVASAQGVAAGDRKWGLAGDGQPDDFLDTPPLYDRPIQGARRHWRAKPDLRIEPMPAVSYCTVYFDGACPVCRREIAHYRRQRGADAIAWIDASSCDETALGPGLDRTRVLSRFHVREADGTLASGAAAFVAIWRRLPAFAWLAKFAGSRPMLALLDAGYAVFLRVRRWWRPADR
jgi:predicted DCC family thiol-disulfide oxidoreductase YuxK